MSQPSQTLHSQGAEYRCEVCAFELWIPIVRLDVGSLGLYSDSRYPGRSVLVLHDHAENLAELDPALLQRFMADVQRAGRAIQNATHANRMNYAVLGNAEPHLHMHLIPRFAGDAYFERSPWSTPDERTALAAADERRLVNAIRAELGLTT